MRRAFPQRCFFSSGTASASSSTGEPFYGFPRPRTRSFGKSNENDHLASSSSSSSSSSSNSNFPNIDPTVLLFPFSLPRRQQERLDLFWTNATAAFQDPTRADAVAAVGELTGQYALQRLLQCMQSHSVGEQLLQEKPVVSKATIPFYQDLLSASATTTAAAAAKHNRNTAVLSTATQDTTSFLPDDDDSHITFGQAYGAYLLRHGFDPDERDDVRYLHTPNHDDNNNSNNDDLTYVMLRYRQCHDFWHALTGLPPTVVGELGLKWLELFQTGMPLAAFSATVGSLRLSFDEQRILWGIYLPWAIEQGRKMPFGSLMNVYYEKEWDTPVGEFRKRLNLTRAPQNVEKPVESGL